MIGMDGDALVRRISDPYRAPEERGEDAHELLQLVFQGFPASGLIPLLRSENSGAVESGIWVLSELGSKAAPLLDEVESLLDAQSRKVRYWAIDVVHSSAGIEDGRIIAKAFGLLEDTDISVRRAALYFLARASESQLTAAVLHLGKSRIGVLVGWLSRVSDSANSVLDITKQIGNDDRLVSMIAVAAAARISGRDRAALECAAAMGDDEISVFASRELER